MVRVSLCYLLSMNAIVSFGSNVIIWLSEALPLWGLKSADGNSHQTSIQYICYMRSPTPSSYPLSRFENDPALLLGSILRDLLKNFLALNISLLLSDLYNLFSVPVEGSLKEYFVLFKIFSPGSRHSFFFFQLPLSSLAVHSPSFTAISSFPRSRLCL